jgi:predicted 2-oxoglutarate/Fe(II)-dependent dioxygenase YbiX
MNWHDGWQNLGHIAAQTSDDPAVVRLTGLYRNLLRDWAVT